MGPYGRLFSSNPCPIGLPCGLVISTNIFPFFCLPQVVDRYYGEQDIRYYMIMVFFPILFLCWIRNLKLLAPFSTMACVVTIASFGITLYYVFTDIPDLSNRNPGGNLKELPLFFGTVMFSMSAIGIIMPLENEMKKPAQFTSRIGVLNVAMLFLAVIYTGFGFFGYVKYGPDTAGSITLNLPQDDLLAQSVKLMLGVAIACTVALPQYIIYDIIWNCHLKSRLEKNSFALAYAYVLKTVVCVLTCKLSGVLLS
ncbi:hypothetical protein WDU94_001542 [Cyamophila willieti]